MTKVYILHDSYAEYYQPIRGVFTSEEKALAWCEKEHRKLVEFSWDGKKKRFSKGEVTYIGHYVNDKFETWYYIDEEELDPE